MGRMGTSHDPIVSESLRVKDSVEVHKKPVIPVTRSQAQKIAVEDEGNFEGISDLFMIQGDNSLSQSGVSKVVEPVHCDKDSHIMAQQSDPDIKLLYGEASSSGDNTGDFEEYIIDSDLLYRVSRPLHASSGEEWLLEKQLVIPRKFHSEVLAAAHENVLGGHFGISKTMKKIKKLYYWPTPKKDVVKLCKTCHICQVSGKPNQKIPPAPLYPIPAISEPFSQVVLDIMGPLPKAKSGHQYLLTMIDRSTRFPEVISLRNIQSKVIIKYLKDFISRYGVPKEIQTDRGTNFTSRLFQRKVSEFGIKQVFSTPYHPQSQGVLERFYATLKNALSKYTLSNLGDWEENLPFVLYAIRSSPNETLGFSPYELAYGHNVRGPLICLKKTGKVQNKIKICSSTY